MSDRRVGQILSRVADARASDTSLPARLCADCLSALPVSGVALALMTEAGPSGVVLAATDGRARQLEELQFALDEGPCVEASHSDHPVLHPELTVTGSVRWPRFGAGALDAGAHAIFAFQLMRAYARSNNRRLSDVAAHIINGTIDNDQLRTDQHTKPRTPPQP